MKEIFDKLYREFINETSDAVSTFVNDPAGYKKWFKSKLYEMCLKFKEASQPDDEACSFRCNSCKKVFSGIDDSYTHCPDCNWPRNA